MRFSIKKDAEWGRGASFSGKSFDSVHWFRWEGCFKDSPIIKYNYLTCLKVVLWFVFVIHGFSIFMVNWKEAFSEPCKTSEVKLFAKLVSNWKPLIFLPKTSALDVWKVSEYASAAYQVNCKFWYIVQFEITFSFAISVQLDSQSKLPRSFDR